MAAKPPIILSQDDFDYITSSKRLCNDTGGVNFESFTIMMKQQLYLYTIRQVPHHFHKKSPAIRVSFLFFFLHSVEEKVNLLTC